MSKYKVELKVVNSGSANDLPCKGAASESYLTLGSVSPDNPGEIEVTNLSAGDICNSGTYSAFVDIKTSKPVNIIELDDSPGAGLVLTFSIYAGNRIMDGIIAILLEKAIGLSFSGLYAKVAANALGGLLDDILKTFEKKLVSQIKKGIRDFVETVAVETVTNFGTKFVNDTVTLKMFSDIDKEGNFLNDTIIEPGDLVAEVTLTMVA
jgi:hypothetical protein